MGFGDRAINYTEQKIAGMHDKLMEWAITMESYAKMHAPWKDQTTNARQGLLGGVERDGTKLILYLSHQMEYGRYLEEGTGIHGPHKQTFAIRPKNKEALFWPGAAHPVKAVLHHPGMKPRAILRPTFDAHIDPIKRSILDYWSGEGP